MSMKKKTILGKYHIYHHFDKEMIFKFMQY